MSDTSTVIPLITPAYTLTGPASLSVGSKAIFRVTPTAGTILSAPLVITPACTLAGAFTPTTVTLPVGSTSTVTFTFTPTEAGSGTLSTTNSASLTDPIALSVFSIALSNIFTTYTLTGTTSLTAGVASTYTITPGAGSPASQAITITPLCSLAGIFSPAVVSLPAGSTSAVTLTFTPTASGVGTLSTSSNGALTDPGDLFITVSSTQTPFTKYSLSGPQALTVGSAATYTVTPGSGTANTAGITIVPSCTLAGTFFPQTNTIPAGSTAPLTFTFTPSVAGTGSFTVTNSAALSNPPAFTVTAMAFSTAYTLTVDSSAFLFSPGNWTGDGGREGSLWRSTWNPGAWFQVSWLASATPTATLHLGPENTGAYITYFLNGAATRDIAAKTDLTLSNILPGQINRLEAFLTRTPNADRWNRGGNCLTISGMTIDPASSAASIVATRLWGKLVGDDTTEGVSADDGSDNMLSSYAYFLLRGMEAAGYRTCVSACTGSGYITAGDSTQDVPAFYSVTGSANGLGGEYSDKKSRWNLIDSGISALDSDGRLSAYGDIGTPPSWIAFNLLSRDALAYANQSDAQAAMTQSLAAHRTAAPDAWLFAIMPFGFHYATTYSATWPQIFTNAITNYRLANPDDDRVVVVDAGTSLAVLLESNRDWYTTTDGSQLLETGQAIFASVVSSAMLSSMTIHNERTYTYY
ncbi:hypothetical protein [Acetobacter sp.]|jgi:hypothetical protein|uniref:hypothetical protein n=1 Tax=Acetobacter sp. TaxID=440 RepID=UPI0025C00F35|nr:hypothetical protein [Acetobacter sp.]MCH4091734.1 hypothetical protein [Acetobacter sp.]MCI1300409.1 hypothetical protein [Acetobacter sp.]MCI1316772.1 hypothetical protein [Acetobacter sp.]